jgi:aminoglycoside 3-N-acetyltransferase
MVTLGMLTAAWRRLGIEEGDAVLLHSALKPVGFVVGGPQMVIASLQVVLGSSGTLIAPAFNFDFCTTGQYSVLSTPSHMGAVSEAVRVHSAAVRAVHPIYPFTALGREAIAVGQECQPRSAYGPTSVFGWLRAHPRGKILVVGLSWNDSMTFFHYVEECKNVPYRWMKVFPGTITYGDYGSPRAAQDHGEWTMFVRGPDVVTNLDPIGLAMENAGLVTVGPVGNTIGRCVLASQAYEFADRTMERIPMYYLAKTGGAARE